LRKRAELPDIHFPDLRLTCATLLPAKCIYPKILSEMLERANIGVPLDTYSHVISGIGEADRRAMEGTPPRLQLAAAKSVGFPGGHIGD
jgi:integrase